jgi:putative membrane protein
MMGGMMTGMGLWMGLWALVGIVIVALAVVGAVWAARELGQRTRAGQAQAELPADGPREILRRRYAAGEIDEDEYLRRLSGMSQH